LISKGSAIRITRRIPTAIAPIFRLRFMSLVLPFLGGNGWL
jgi:hypothetical protein